MNVSIKIHVFAFKVIQVIIVKMLNALESHQIHRVYALDMVVASLLISAFVIVIMVDHYVQRHLVMEYRVVVNKFVLEEVPVLDLIIVIVKLVIKDMNVIWMFLQDIN